MLLMSLKVYLNNMENKKMRLISYSMVKNEEDIIEMFIRRNLNILDHMYISDNMSSDKTKKILNSLIAEGLPITVWDDLDPRHLQSKKTTSAYKKISKNDEFDAIFFIDSDEFLIGDTSKLDDYYKLGAVYELKRVRYIISELNSSQINFFSLMEYKYKEKESSKSMIFHDQNNYDKIRIGEGNHHIYYHGKGKLNKGALNLQIAHFPIRSKEQFIRKNLIGWLALMQNEPQMNKKEKPIGSHWRNAYRFIMDRNCDLSDKDFYQYLYKANSIDELKEKVIYDPIKTDIKLKYTKVFSEKSTLTLLAKAYEKSIEYNWQNILKSEKQQQEQTNDFKKFKKQQQDLMNLIREVTRIRLTKHPLKKYKAYKSMLKAYFNII